MESPSLCAGLICLDCLFPFSLRIAASLASPQGGKLWGCKVLLFPQLLTITPVTVRLSITSSHQTHTEQIEPAGIQTHIIHKKKETGFTGGVERWRGSCQHLLRLTGKCAQMHTHIHTPQSTTLWRYLFNIGRIYSASLYVASNHADLQCQQGLLCWEPRCKAHTCRNDTEAHRSMYVQRETGRSNSLKYSQTSKAP